MTPVEVSRVILVARLEVTNLWNDLGQIVAGGILVPDVRRIDGSREGQA